MSLELKDGEVILADAAANLVRGIESVGGRLLVTNSRLVFRSHTVNLQRMPAEVPLDQIAQILRHNYLGIVPNGIRVRLKSGVEYKFMVWGRSRLLQVIRENMPQG